MIKKAHVDKNICIGCSVCSEACPSVFKVKEDPDYAHDFKSFTDDSIDQHPLETKVQEAIDSCPVHCISWKEINEEDAQKE